MSRPRVLRLVVAVILAMLFLIGCESTAPAPVAEAPPATDTPVPSADTPIPEADAPAATSTPTPEPPTPTPVPPTAIPTEESAQPQAGATFTGSMESSGEESEGTASGGTINFTISEDGASITSIEYTLVEVKCPNVSVDSLEQGADVSYSVTNGEIVASLARAKIQGEFSSPTEASGTIDLVVELPFSGSCDLGMWNWSAKADASTSILQTPNLEATTGTVRGRIIGAESQKPLTGAAVVLCLDVGEKTCVLQADLVSISGEDGSFALTEVAPGSHVVFYDPSGEASGGWEEIDGSEMILNLEGLSGFASPARTELFSTFGGGGDILWQKGTSLEFTAGGVVGDGSIISEKYGLTMDFYEGKPITIEIQPGQITDLEIKAWAQ